MKQTLTYGVIAATAAAGGAAGALVPGLDSGVGIALGAGIGTALAAPCQGGARRLRNHHRRDHTAREHVSPGAPRAPR